MKDEGRRVNDEGSARSAAFGGRRHGGPLTVTAEDQAPDPVSDKPWYHRGLRFKCTRCGNCCTGDSGYVWVNKAEIEAIAAALGMEVEEFEKKYVRQVGIRKSLVELPGGDCALFDNRSRTCRVYEVRPRQCRTWPFWPSNLRTPESWDQTCQECPGSNRGPLVPLRKIRALSDEMRV